ncbi:MAG: YjbF family lipoprotein [Paracoccaceae bacterium]
MIRQSLLFCLALSLGACSSGGTSPVFSAIKGVILPSDEDEKPAKAPATITRARIEQSGLAIIRGRLEGEDITNILSATSLNGTYVTYVSAFKQTVTMNGSLVTATRGLGGDLLAVRNDANDPVAVLTPPKDWPTHLTRDYRFPADGPAGNVVTLDCALTRGGETEITIVELDYTVTAFSEVCSGKGVNFTNIYLADAKSGQIWQARQWVGEKLGYLNIEVLEPFTLD